MDFHSLGEGINDALNWAAALGPFWLYALIALGNFVENVFPPFPGDTVTIAGAALATRGELSFIGVFLCAYGGGVLSAMLVFDYARRHGHDFFMKRQFKLFPPDRIKKLENWLLIYGALIIAAHRFLLGLRSVLTVSAGVLRWPVHKMFFYTSVSFWLFNALLIYATYLLIDNLSRLTHILEVYQIYVFALVGLLLLWVVIRWRMHKSAKAQ